MRTTQSGVIGAVAGVVISGLAYLGLPEDTFCPAPEPHQEESGRPPAPQYTVRDLAGG